MCVLGLCALIDMEQIPQVLNQVSGQILPAFILLFNGLKRAYACHAEHENDSDDDDEAEDDDETGKEFVVQEARLTDFEISLDLFFSLSPKEIWIIAKCFHVHSFIERLPYLPNRVRCMKAGTLDRSPTCKALLGIYGF